jgi:hypothetical protein
VWSAKVANFTSPSGAATTTMADLEQYFRTIDKPYGWLADEQ